jgi:hypothetical protein
MFRFGLLLSVTMASACGVAQPLIDLLQGNVLLSERMERMEVSASLPLKIDTLGQLLIVDPYAISWSTQTEGARYPLVDGADRHEYMAGVGGAVTWVKPLGHGWRVVGAGILRYHWLGDLRRSAVQPGGAVLLARAFSERLTMRIGMYANHEAFGWFLMPLLGIDWRINERMNLYGTLPGALTLERRSRPWLHWGASFRAYTTSFGERDGDFRRINENPVGLYADWYAVGKLVLRAETGWCFFRRYWGGSGDPLHANASSRARGYADHGLPDAPYVRVALAYRLRLDRPIGR